MFPYYLLYTCDLSVKWKSCQATYSFPKSRFNPQSKVNKSNLSLSFVMFVKLGKYYFQTKKKKMRMKSSCQKFGQGTGHITNIANCVLSLLAPPNN